MMPKPPSWMSARITTCPKGLQWLAVSSTTSPVTQVALVAVKRASMNLVPCPSAEAIGSMSSPVPTLMRTMNRPSRVTAGGGALRIRRGWRTVNCSGRVRWTRTRRSPGRRPSSVMSGGQRTVHDTQRSAD